MEENKATVNEKKSKEWLGGGIEPLLRLFNAALHLSHSY